MAGPTRRGGLTLGDRRAGPELRVGIVSWNTAEHLDRCLTALPAALDGLDAEVVVVDNASADASVEVAGRHAVTVVANPDNRGYAVAMNQALADTDASWLLALNPDTVPGPGSLRRLVERARAMPDAGIVVPRLVHPDGRPQHSAYRFPGPVVPLVAALSTRRLRRSAIGRRLLLEGSGAHAGGTVDWAIGAVHLIRAPALAGEAPYSTRSFMYAEDLELCWRLTQRGAPTVVVDDVEIVHVGNAAGEQAWGDERSVRYWTATYDVIALRRSPAAARRAALGATVAATISLVRLAIAARRPSDDGRSARHAAAIRRAELRVHARTALRGPAPAPTYPTSGPPTIGAD